MLLQHPVQCKQHFLFWPPDILSLEVSEEEEGGEVSTPPNLLVEGKVSVINQTAFKIGINLSLRSCLTAVSPQPWVTGLGLS